MDRALRDVCAPEPVPQNLLIGAGINIGMRPEGYVSASADLVGATRSLPAQAARYETELKTPGGILFGADDAILSPELHGHSMEPHGLFCEILPGRGHMIPITAAEECASFIKKVAERAQR
jgi:pimeloyl-ACP methyl ester carboxylesterase